AGASNGGTIMSAWQAGHLIWRPAQRSSPAICWPQVGQANLNSFISGSRMWPRQAAGIACEPPDKCSRRLKQERACLPTSSTDQVQGVHGDGEILDWH